MTKEVRNPEQVNRDSYAASACFRSPSKSGATADMAAPMLRFVLLACVDQKAVLAGHGSNHDLAF
jgi:hypothetical protein